MIPVDLAIGALLVTAGSCVWFGYLLGRMHGKEICERSHWKGDSSQKRRQREHQ